MSSKAPVSNLVASIIPAAGANTRLTGQVAPFLKPTILVDGRPLIQHACTHAWTKWEVLKQDTIIVVSPQNASVIPNLVPSGPVKYVLQPEPRGIVDAIARALPLVKCPWTCILCADNIFREATTEDFTFPLFASKELHPHDANRFTTYSVHGPQKFQPAGKAYGSTTCWIGPLILPTQLLNEYFDNTPGTQIVDLLNRINEQTEITPYPMLCSDMGVPEEIV